MLGPCRFWTQQKTAARLWHQSVEFPRMGWTDWRMKGRDILEISLQLWLAQRNFHCLNSDLFLSVVCPTTHLLQWDLPLILSHHGTELACIGPYCSPESPPLSPPALLLFCASSLGNYLPPRTWGPEGNIENCVFSWRSKRSDFYIIHLKIFILLSFTPWLWYEQMDVTYVTNSQQTLVELES